MKSKVYIGTSLDGFIAREDGDFGWLSQFADDEAIHAYHEFMTGIDAIVIGRGTFEKVLDFPSWPYDKKVFVLSNNIKQLPDSVTGKAMLLSMKPTELLNYLSAKRFSNIYVDGGKVIQGFLKEDLIDEIAIAKATVLIGLAYHYLDIWHRPSVQACKNSSPVERTLRSYYERLKK